MGWNKQFEDANQGFKRFDGNVKLFFLYNILNTKQFIYLLGNNGQNNQKEKCSLVITIDGSNSDLLAQSLLCSQTWAKWSSAWASQRADPTVSVLLQ